MSSTNAFFPTIIPPNSLRPLSIDDAQQILSTYLRRSERLPHLHPDALLQPSGPTFSVQGGPMGGLVLQQLRRVEAGLRGEILKPDPKASTSRKSDDRKLDALIAETEAGAVAFDETPRKKGGLKRKVAVLDAEDSQNLVDGQENAEDLTVAQLDSDWEADLHHGTEYGEMGDRSNLVEYAGEIPQVKVPKKPSKDERKAAKKERKKLEKVQRAATKQERNAEEEALVNGVGMKVAKSKERLKEKEKKERKVEKEETKQKKKKKKMADAVGD